MSACGDRTLRFILWLEAPVKRIQLAGASFEAAKQLSCDIANAVAGALVTAYKEPGVRNFNRKLDYMPLGIV